MPSCSSANSCRVPRSSCSDAATASTDTAALHMFQAVLLARCSAFKGELSDVAAVQDVCTARRLCRHCNPPLLLPHAAALLVRLLSPLLGRRQAVVRVHIMATGRRSFTHLVGSRLSSVILLTWSAAASMPSSLLCADYMQHYSIYTISSAVVGVFCCRHANRTKCAPTMLIEHVQRSQGPKSRAGTLLTAVP